MDLRASLHRAQAAITQFLHQPLTPLPCLLAGLGCALLGSGGWIALEHFAPRVTVTDSAGLVRVVRTRGTVADALHLAQITLGPHDLVSAPLVQSIPNLHRIHIRRAVPITIVTADGEFELLTTATDIAELKKDPRLAMSEIDRLWPRSGTPIQPRMRIKLARVTTSESIETAPIPPGVSFTHDPALPRGATAFVSQGAPGLQEVRVVNYFKDGVFTGAQRIPGAIIKAAVPEIRKVGVRALAMSRSERGNRVLTMEATAYEPGPRSCGIYANGYTATGRRATYGVCAVDPRVIPLGTRLFVEGYGVAIAADVGGAIKGLKIDVCFDTVAEALRWGRRRVKVYILDEFTGTIPILDRAGNTQKIVAVSKPTVPGTSSPSPAPAPESPDLSPAVPSATAPAAAPSAPEPMPAAPPAEEAKPIDLLPPPIDLLPTSS